MDPPNGELGAEDVAPVPEAKADYHS